MLNVNVAGFRLVVPDVALSVPLLVKLLGLMFSTLAVLFSISPLLTQPPPP